MLRAAVMGDMESIQGFAAVGLDVFVCDHAQEAAGVFRRLCGGEYGVVFLTETLAQALEKELDRLEEAPLPAVIPIPGVKGNTGIGMRRVREAVERAVGTDILFDQ